MLSFDTDDLSCYEDGGWMELKVMPNANSSEFQIDKAQERWDLKNISREKQPPACELLRLKNKAKGWSLSNGSGPASWCTVYKEVTSPKPSKDAIRGIACPSSGLRQGSKYNETQNHGKLLQQVEPNGQSKFKTSISRIPRPTSKPSMITNKTVNVLSWKSNGITSLAPTTMPAGIDQPHDLSLTGADIYIVLVLSVLLVCSLLIALRRSRLIIGLRVRVRNLLIFSKWNDDLVTKRADKKFVSNDTSEIVSSHYCHPFTKKSVVLSEKEYLPLDDETSR